MSRNIWLEDYGYRKDDPEAPHARPIRAKARKNTRRWCKGKVGREHQPTIELKSFYANQQRPCWREEQPRRYDWSVGCYHQEVCSTCGKILRWSVEYEECPTLNPAPEPAPDPVPDPAAP